MKGLSPFTPGSPVPADLFVGRQQQLDEINSYLAQAIAGRQENVFLCGERGIGKSSVGAYVRQALPEASRFFAVHVFLGGVTALDELVRRVFEGIVTEAQTATWLENARDGFLKYVNRVELAGYGVSFTPPRDQLEALVRNFPAAIANILDKVRPFGKGLLIVLDDIDDLAKTVEFANWYKSFADTVATHYSDYPVLVMPIGLPEVRDSLGKAQPSLMRVFRAVDVAKLSDVEVGDFYTKAFNKVGMTVGASALASMTNYSGGLPVIMHEIGDAVFRGATETTVGDGAAFAGVLNAATSIGKKYLDPNVYRAIRSTRYRSTLRKLCTAPASKFRKSTVRARLSDAEKKVFDNFLTKMKELGIIVGDLEGGSGAYKFVNELYPVYIWLEALSTARRTAKGVGAAAAQAEGAEKQGSAQAGG
jgi:hypothetical protein